MLLKTFVFILAVIISFYDFLTATHSYRKQLRIARDENKLLDKNYATYYWVIIATKMFIVLVPAIIMFTYEKYIELTVMLLALLVIVIIRNKSAILVAKYLFTPIMYRSYKKKIKKMKK